MAEISVISPTQYGGLPLPGKCKLCGSVDREIFINTGVHEEFYGMILYCNLCVGDIAGRLGFISEAKADELRLMAKEALVTNKDLQDRITKLTGAVDALVSAGYTPNPNDNLTYDSDSIDSVFTDSPQRGTSELGEGKGTSTEQEHDTFLAGLRTNEHKRESLGLQFG